MQIFSEGTSELINHALLVREVLLGKASELLEHDVVLVNRQAALLQIAELFMLALNNTLRNVVSIEVLMEFIPGNHTTSSGIFVLLIPLCSLVFELERGKIDKVRMPDITALEMLADIHEPIISVCCLNTIAEGLWLVSKELVECSKLILIVAMALICLVRSCKICIRICVLALVAAITACHASGGGGGGGGSRF